MTHLLEPVGLSERASEVYLHLLGRGELGADQIAEAVGVPVAAAAAALAELTAAGLCAPLPGMPSRYFAAPPDVALESVVLERQRRLDVLRSDARQLALQARATRVGPDQMIQRIEGEAAVLALLAELELGSRHEVLIIDRPPYLDGAADNVNELQALGRGVSYRAIYHAPTLAEPGRAAMLERFLAAGEQARSLPDAQMKMLIVDRRQAVIPPDFATADATTRLLIGPSPLLDALLLAFESLWEKAVPLGGRLPAGARPGGADDLSPRDLAILRMLTAGAKDRTIARALRIGERTVMRRIQALMEALNADTRFQAGVQAALRGWLDTREQPPAQQ
ncbi:helix-turn-helix domain-containing protein [Kitasatospora sp. NPDC058965]|uniref:helix-turn-helix transcriptional regulator n=1 Tax=Kitasatospora sp. NPDC058965 TaxID=3346682 RepID=UPI0036CD5880